MRNSCSSLRSGGEIIGFAGRGRSDRRKPGEPSEPLNVRLDQQYEQNVPPRWRGVNDGEGKNGWMTLRS